MDTPLLRRVLQDAVLGRLVDGHPQRLAGKQVLRDASGRNAMVASVHPLAASGRAGNQAAVLFLQPLGTGRVLAADLRQLFGLTAAEASLACALHRHADLALAAQECGICLSTAQTRIKLMYDKTGERGLPALMRLLAAVARVGE